MSRHRSVEIELPVQCKNHPVHRAAVAVKGVEAKFATRHGPLNSLLSYHRHRSRSRLRRRLRHPPCRCAICTKALYRYSFLARLWVGLVQKTMACQGATSPAFQLAVNSFVESLQGFLIIVCQSSIGQAQHGA